MQINSWLEEYKNAGLIKITTNIVRVKEEPFGAYDLRVIHLQAGKQEVVFQPAGRFITDATGRIDMFVKGRGSLQERYRFLRKEEGDEDFWILVGPDEQRGILGMLTSYTKWNKRDFELALDKLLK